jgi:hypothetical protein
MTLNGNPATAAPPGGKTNGTWLTRFQALSIGDEGEEAYRIFYVGAEKPAIGSTTFFAGSGMSAEDAVPGNGCLVTTSENCKVLQYPAEQSATGTIVGNTIRIDVPVQGGFGPSRPVLGEKLLNVTALSAGRDSIPYDFYADLDATKSFDYSLSGVGGHRPPHCDDDHGHHDHGHGNFDDHGHHGKFSMNACDRGHEDREKARYHEDGNDFRSTRIDSDTHAGNTATITGAGIHAGRQVTFSLVATDNGISGDVFSLQLSDGFSRTGTLTTGGIEGS